MLAAYGKDYPFARSRTYVLPMPAAQVETFYQEAIPGLQFHRQGKMKFISTTVGIKGNQVVAVTRKEYLSNRKRGGAPKEGLWVYLFENRAMPQQIPRFNLLYLPVAAGDVYSILQIMNFREVTVR